MRSDYHEVSFNSQIEAGEVTLSTSVIGISTYHKFRNAERIIYNPDGQQAIGGIATDGSYFVSSVSNTSFTLHNTENDAISGINTITFTSFGLGKHKIRSYNKKLSLRASLLLILVLVMKTSREPLRPLESILLREVLPLAIMIMSLERL